MPLTFVVDKGTAVALDKFMALGVPKFGVTNVGEFDNKTLPVPVTETSSTVPTPAEVLPNNLLELIVWIFAKVTASSIILAVEMNRYRDSDLYACWYPGWPIKKSI